MAKPEAGVPNSEPSRIILLDQNNVATEIQPVDNNGKLLLDSVRTTLLVGQRANVVTATPFRLDGLNPALQIAEQPEPPKAPTFTTPERTLELVTAEYRANRASPQLLAEFNQVFWEAKRQAMGLSQADLVVSEAPYKEDDIRKFMKLGRRFGRVRKPADFALFIPQVVSTAPEGLILLGKGWPEMGSWTFQEGTSVKNEDEERKLIEIFGWMRTEKAIDALYLGKNEDQARQAIGKNRIGDTLNIYGIAGQQSKLLEGKYLDQTRTWIKTLSSRFRGQVLGADFHGYGYLRVDWLLRSSDIHDHLGARSVEVAKT